MKSIYLFYFILKDKIIDLLIEYGWPIFFFIDMVFQFNFPWKLWFYMFDIL